jgi:hypothetical protein
LHQEIIGLNEYLSEVLDGAGDESATVGLGEFHRRDAAEVNRSGNVEAFEDGEESSANEPTDAVDREPRDSSPPREPEQSHVVIEQWKGENISPGETGSEESTFEESTLEPAAADPTPAEESAEEESGQSTLPIGDRFPEKDEVQEVVARDDSDLLVIEDDVEIRRIDAAKRYDSLDQTISVDFQAMLSRMRSRSE